MKYSDQITEWQLGSAQPTQGDRERAVDKVLDEQEKESGAGVLKQKNVQSEFHETFPTNPGHWFPEGAV